MYILSLHRVNFVLRHACYVVVLLSPKKDKKDGEQIGLSIHCRTTESYMFRPGTCLKAEVHVSHGVLWRTASNLVLYECFLRLRDNNQLVLPNATVLLTTTACGVDLVYWILWLSLGKLVLLGHLSLYIEWCQLSSCSYVAYPGYLVLEYGMSISYNTLLSTNNGYTCLLIHVVIMTHRCMLPLSSCSFLERASH